MIYFTNVIVAGGYVKITQTRAIEHSTSFLVVRDKK